MVGVWLTTYPCGPLGGPSRRPLRGGLGRHGRRQLQGGRASKPRNAMRSLRQIFLTWPDGMGYVGDGAICSHLCRRCGRRDGRGRRGHLQQHHGQQPHQIHDMLGARSYARVLAQVCLAYLPWWAAVWAGWWARSSASVSTTTAAADGQSSPSSTQDLLSSSTLMSLDTRVPGLRHDQALPVLGPADM